MKTRVLVFILIFGIGAVAVGWVYESELRDRVIKTELVIPSNIDYFLTNLNYRAINQAGQLDYEFDSSRLEHFPRTDVSHITTPTLQIYRDNERWRVDAGQGEFEHADNLLRLREQVVMQKGGENPLQIVTEGIRFEPDLDLVTSEASVLLRDAHSQIEAEAAVFDLASKVYRLTKTRAIYRNGKS